MPYLDYDIAMIKEWDILTNDCLEQSITWVKVLEDLASKLDWDEKMNWGDDIIYILPKWHKQLKLRREEYNRVRKIQPAKKSPAEIKPQRRPDTIDTPIAPQAALTEENFKPTLKRGRKEDLEEKCDFKRPRLEAVILSSTCPS